MSKNKINFNESLLIEVLHLQAKGDQDKLILDYLLDATKKYKQTRDKHGNLYVTKGTAKLFPCLVSHIDQVHELITDKKVYKCGDFLAAFSNEKHGQVGIGGDDLSGVALCLMALADLPNVKIVFFREEETGCIGSGRADMSFFDDCTVVGQADRRSNEGFVTEAMGAKLSSKRFQDNVLPILTAHKYKFCHGAMTDVATLKRKGLKVSCFNIECGYYNPHSDEETVCISDTEDCYHTIMEIFNICKDKKYEHTHETQVYTGYSGTKYGHDRYKHHWDHDFYSKRDELPLAPGIYEPRTTRNDIKSNLISEDPREVNTYLAQRDADNPYEDIDENEDIQLWEEVMLTKKEYDSAFEDYTTFLTKKAQIEGRI